MVTHLNKKETEESTKLPIERLKVIYDSARRDENAFPHPALLDPVDCDEHEQVCKAFERMIHTAANNGISAEQSKEMERIVQRHINIFRTSLCS